MRSTKPPISEHDSARLEFWLKTPSFGAQCGYRVSTVRRITGELPLAAATKFMVPIDNPSGSNIERLPSLRTGR